MSLKTRTTENFVQHFVKFATKLGLTQSSLDPCLFMNGDISILLIVYVDDILLAATHMELIDEFVTELTDKY